MPVRSGAAPPRYRAVLFDVGGTLVEDQDFLGYSELALPLGVVVDEEAIAGAYRDLVHAASGAPDPADHPAFWQTVLARATGGPIAAQTAERFAERLAARPRSARLYSDARRTLAKLSEQGRRLGVVSNSRSEEGLRALLGSLGILASFATVVAAGTEGVAKPDPEIFHRAVRRLGVRPEEAFYVGDLADLDARAAARAGLGSVWLHRDGTGFGTDPPEITTLTELLPWIARAERAPVK